MAEEAKEKAHLVARKYFEKNMDSTREESISGMQPFYRVTAVGDGLIVSDQLEQARASKAGVPLGSIWHTIYLH